MSLLLLALLACDGGSADPQDPGPDSASDTTDTGSGSSDTGTHDTEPPLDPVEKEYCQRGWITHLKEALANEPGTRPWSSREEQTFDANDAPTSFNRYYGSHSTPEFSVLIVNDASGAPIFREQDTDGDGTIDQRITWTRDAEGKRLTEEHDGNADPDDDIFADGLVDNRLSFTYNSDGDLARVDMDSDGNGQLDTYTEWTYDAARRVVQEYTPNELGYTHTFDATGCLTATIEGTGPQNDSVLNVFAYTCDANNEWLTSEKTFLGSGPPIKRITWTRDTWGRPLTMSIDNGGYGSIYADGVPEELETWSYDSDGNELTHSIDDNADGIIDYETLRTYDGNGYLIERVIVTPDGRRYRFTYINDASGRVLVEDLDSADDGTVDYHDTYTWLQCDE